MTFWYGWPSWLVELLSGLLVASVVQFVVGVSWQAVAALAASLTYEGALDKNGWSWKDVGQRAVGIAVGLALWAWIRQ